MRSVGPDVSRRSRWRPITAVLGIAALLIVPTVSATPSRSPNAPGALGPDPRGLDLRADEAPRASPTIGGLNWTNLANLSNGPIVPVRFDAGLAAYPPANEVVLFGGESPSGSALGDTWAFGSNWSWAEQPSTHSPSARTGPAMAYDAAASEIVLFSGLNASDGLVRDTWAFAQGQWTQLHPLVAPPARSNASFVPDANGSGLILFGGVGAKGPLNDTWWFSITPSGPRWINLTATAGPAPYPRWSAAAANLTSPAEDVLFGGNSTDGVLTDTWVFNGSTWRELPPRADPGDRTGASMAFDQVDGVDVLFGGLTNHSNPLASTWTFNGSGWSQPALGPTRPHQRYAGSMTWAGGWAGGIVLLVGGTAGPNATFGGPYAFASRIPLIAPTPVGSSQSIDSGTPVDFEESALGGTPPYSYIWHGLPTPCAGTGSAEVTCEPVSNVSTPSYFQPFVTVADGAGGQVVSPATFVVVNAVLSLTALTFSPDPVGVGDQVTISVQRSGGGNPLNLTYTGLPAGCVSENLTTFTCVPTQFGSFEVNVSVRDPYGENASLVSSLTVQGSSLSPATTIGLEYIALGAFIVAVIVVAGFWRARSRRAPRAPAPSPGSPPSGSPPVNVAASRPTPPRPA